MPGLTPIYEFPYPCPGEAIDPGSFADLAAAIDTKLLDLRTQETAARGRPRVHQERFGFVTGSGVDATITGAGSSYVLPQNGLYVINVTVTAGAAFSPGVTGARFLVEQNGTNRFGSVIHEVSSGSSPRSAATGIIVGAAGDTMTVRVRYTGVDPTLTFDMTLSARMIVRIP